MQLDKQADVAPARRLALIALRRMDVERRYAEEILGELLPDVGDRDRRLAAALTYGVIRHRLTLDHVLKAFSRNGKAPRPMELLEILRIALYQILFMDRIPPHAAISQSVEMAKALAPQAAGYANGLLRTIQGATGPMRDENPRAILPRPDGRSLEFDRPIFPPPEQAVEHLAVTTSHPPWLIDRWIRQYGGDRAREIALADNCVLPTTLRVNPLRTSRDKLQEALSQADHDVTAGRRRPEALHARRTAGLTGVPGYHDGHFSVQDEAAMAVAPMLADHHPRRVLDLCSGVGGKSTHLAELTADTVPIAAVDFSREKLAMQRQNIARLQLRQVAPVRADGTHPPFRPVFDAILLDAPCTNSGVLSRRPEARWRLSEEDFARCAALQKRLLAAAVPLLSPGGRLLYSTCSIDPEENEEVVSHFLRTHYGFRVETTKLDLPSDTAGGGFRAVLVSSS